MNLSELLLHQATLRPQAPALVDWSSGRRRLLTFGQLAVAAGQAAHFLKQAHLRPGDRVLIFLPMSAELYVALAGIFSAGLVALFMDPGQGQAQLEAACQQLPPRALLATPKAHLLRLVSPALRRIPIQFATGWGVPGARRWSAYQRLTQEASPVACPAETPALITLTSGSTGQPKATVRSHGFLQAQHTVLDQTLNLTPADQVLTTLPIFVLSHLAAGVCTVIPGGDLRQPAKILPAPLVAQIQAEGVTCLEGSPTLIERLADYCARFQLTLPSLRAIFTGGAPVFPRTLAVAQQLAPQATVSAVYGSTEAEPVAHIRYHEMTPQDLARSESGGGLLAGAPVAAIQVHILPDRWGQPVAPYTAAHFAADQLPANGVGEIVVTGAHVLNGYLGGVGDEENKFRVEESVWHRTGDAGYLDRAGRLWLLGRCAARVVTAAGTLYPLAVEAAAHRYEFIRRSALVAVGGRKLLALELQQPATPAQLHSLQKALAWAQLDELRIVKRIPVDRRHNAKVDYPALHRLLTRDT
jgi:olefin beta-lactone synthetase